MSAYLRPRRPGACIFFTVCLAERGSRLLVDEIDRLRWAVAVTRRERPFQVDAWIVLPDHMHAVWTLPGGDAGYSVRWGAIKARFTRSLREAGRPGFSPASGFPVVRSGRYAGLKPGLRAHKRECAIWQRRFWEHHVRDAEEYDALVDYCRQNPVKHGFVKHAKDWPYSSFRTPVGRASARPLADRMIDLPDAPG